MMNDMRLRAVLLLGFLTSIADGFSTRASRNPACVATVSLRQTRSEIAYPDITSDAVNYDIDFEIVGEPVPLGRHRLSGKHIYNPSSKLQRIFLETCRPKLPNTPLEGPLEAQLGFYFKRPLAHYRSGKLSSVMKENAPLWHTQRKDLDNCVKFVLDALNSVAYLDDRQIVALRCVKYYADTEPKSVVKIRRLET